MGHNLQKPAQLGAIFFHVVILLFILAMGARADAAVSSFYKCDMKCGGNLGKDCCCMSKASEDQECRSASAWVLAHVPEPNRSEALKSKDCNYIKNVASLWRWKSQQILRRDAEAERQRLEDDDRRASLRQQALRAAATRAIPVESSGVTMNEATNAGLAAGLAGRQAIKVITPTLPTVRLPDDISEGVSRGITPSPMGEYLGGVKGRMQDVNSIVPGMVGASERLFESSIIPGIDESLHASVRVSRATNGLSHSASSPVVEAMNRYSPSPALTAHTFKTATQKEEIRLERDSQREQLSPEQRLVELELRLGLPTRRDFEVDVNEMLRQTAAESWDAEARALIEQANWNDEPSRLGAQTRPTRNSEIKWDEEMQELLGK